jgi:homocysteine S-methyltransferase
MIEKLGMRFITLVEVMPPGGPKADRILNSLRKIRDLPVDAFTVPTNPVARPYLDALTLCVLIGRETGRPAVLHCTTRDHNSIALQGLLWGAINLGIDTVIAASGDRIGVPDSGRITPVHDMDVFGLIGLARREGLQTGAVLDPRWGVGSLEREAERLAQKAEAGAQFVVTQPIYDRPTAETVSKAVEKVDIPTVMGILPLWTSKHAEFLHKNVAGIHVPDSVRQRMAETGRPKDEGVNISRQMAELARELFDGMCIMPPFGHYEILTEILGG